MATMIGPVVLILLAFLASAATAGEYCGYDYFGSYGRTYCIYGCCGYRNAECCSGSVGLIVGLCVGGAVVLFFIILTICLCRRRRYNGVVYRSQPVAGAVVVQQSAITTQGGVVTTAGVQPGVTYPPYSQYPVGMTSAPQSPYPAAYPAAYPPQPMPYAAGPPDYSSLNFNPDGGITNKGFQ